jgi:branched-chain amino acid transport system ATP-binding protein
MAELVKRLRSRQRVSILLAEQNLRLALAVCDRVYVLERGEMVYGGPAEAFAHLPDLQRRYLGVGLGI